MKAQNEYFCHEVQVDSNNVIKNVFWSHASQRVEYRDFGDVVTFDTTYKTNMYSMPLAMFVGSNHQLQNVVFGQELLQDEQANTFEWLFETFQNCMFGSRDPRCILTGEICYYKNFLSGTGCIFSVIVTCIILQIRTMQWRQRSRKRSRKPSTDCAVGTC
jgi:hypothetical protein